MTLEETIKEENPFVGLCLEFGVIFLATHLAVTAASAGFRYMQCKSAREEESPFSYYLHCVNRRILKPSTLKTSFCISLPIYCVYSFLSR